MWSPEGYLTFNEFGDSCLSLVQVAVRERWPSPLRPLSKETRKSALAAKPIAKWLINRSLDENIWSICWPHGGTCHVQTEFFVFFTNSDEPIISEIDASDNRNPLLFQPFEDGVDPPELWLDHWADLDYTFIDCSAGLLKESSDIAEARFRRFNEQVSGRWAAYIAEQRRLAVHLSKTFSGASLCLQRESAIKWLQEAIASESAGSDTRRAPGRRKIRQAAARDFMSTYSRGLEEVSLSEASRVLGYDRKTLREGLREVGLYGDANGD